MRFFLGSCVHAAIVNALPAGVKRGVTVETYSLITNTDRNAENNFSKFRTTVKLNSYYFFGSSIINIDPLGLLGLK